MEPTVETTATTPTPVPMQTVPKKGMNKAVIIIVVALILLFLCCVCTLAGAFLIYQTGTVTIGDTCYMNGKMYSPVNGSPCQPVSTTTNPSSDAGGSTTTPAPAVTMDQVFSGTDYSFTYPSTYTLNPDDQGDQTLTTPEGDTIQFAKAVPESGNLTDTTCADYANTFLSHLKLESDQSATLVDNSIETTAGRDSCVFDIDATFSGKLNHLRYVYFVSNSKGYLVILSATDDSTTMADMLTVVESVQLK